MTGKEIMCLIATFISGMSVGISLFRLVLVWSDRK